MERVVGVVVCGGEAAGKGGSGVVAMAGKVELVNRNSASSKRGRDDIVLEFLQSWSLWFSRTDLYICGHEKKNTMEWLPMCEKLEKVVGERNWLDMMIVYCRDFVDKHRDFALRVNRLIGYMRVACEDRVAFIQELRSVKGETVSTKTAAFLEEMMNKEGSQEWRLCDLEKGAREMAFEIDSFMLKLMDEEPSHTLPICDELRISVNTLDWEPQFILRCRREISEDLRLAREINALCYRLTAVVDERKAFVDELYMLAGEYVPGKMAEFIKQVQNKDISNLMKLQILGREFELRAYEKELFIKKLKGLMVVQLSVIFLFLWVSGRWREKGPLAICSFPFASWIWSFTGCTAVAGLIANVVPSFESLLVRCSTISSHNVSSMISHCRKWISKRDKIAHYSDATYVICKSKKTLLLQELSRTADSYDIRDQLSVLFRREVVKDSQRMHDYYRLSDELTEGVKMRDEYMNELRMLVKCEEILESIEIMRRMQVDDMGKGSRLMVMASAIQTKVHEKYCFIVKLRG
nr:hypothetical protein [Tanacetum cinerariifolium]